MSNATSAASVEESVDGTETAAALSSLLVPVETDGMRAWAEALVDQARSEGVALTGEDGLLTSMVREVLQTGLDVEMADHLGYEPYESIGRGLGTVAMAPIPRRSGPMSDRWSCGCRVTVKARLSRSRCLSMCVASTGWVRT